MPVAYFLGIFYVKRLVLFFSTTLETAMKLAQEENPPTQFNPTGIQNVNEMFLESSDGMYQVQQKDIENTHIQKDNYNPDKTEIVTSRSGQIPSVARPFLNQKSTLQENRPRHQFKDDYSISQAALWFSELPPQLFDHMRRRDWSQVQVEKIKKKWKRIKDRRNSTAHHLPEVLKVDQQCFRRMLQDLQDDGYICEEDKPDMFQLFPFLQKGMAHLVTMMNLQFQIDAQLAPRLFKNGGRLFKRKELL